VRRALFALALALTGCGGAGAMPAKSPEPSPPPSPSDGAEKEDSAAPSPGSYAQPPAVSAGADVDDGVSSQRMLETLDSASRAFEQSYSKYESALASRRDCVTAKKALESMERSQRRICELNGSDDPGGRCRTARARLEDARERVKNICG
jgi:hypothetical protein